MPFTRSALLPAVALAALTLAALSAPAAHAQANVTFTGGNGAPLTININNSITYTVTVATAFVGPIFLFDGAANIPRFIDYPSTGTVTFTRNGGAATPITFTRNGYSGDETTPDDLLLIGDYVPLSVGDVITLNFGSVTTGRPVFSAPPANGVFTTFLTDNFGTQISSNGVAVNVANPVPEPGAMATGSLLGATMLLGMVRGRRRKSIKGTAKAA